MELITDERPWILRILRELDKARPVGRHRHNMWEECWKENDRPRYFDTAGVIRRHSKLYSTANKTVEQSELRAHLTHLAHRFLKGLPIVEFGCGAGQNLLTLRDQGYGPLSGFDWAESAVRRVLSHGIDAGRFDFFKPDHELQLYSQAFLTVHALEQIGSDWRPWLDFVMKQKPAIVVHIEPLYELYNPDELLDNLAMRYHETREYLTGYLPEIRLRHGGEVELLLEKRMYFGNLFHEAYSVLVWRPV